MTRIFRGVMLENDGAVFVIELIENSGYKSPQLPIVTSQLFILN